MRLFINAEVPWVQDGTRMVEANRNRLDDSHRETLSKYGASITELDGSYEERDRQAIACVEDFFKIVDI